MTVLQKNTLRRRHFSQKLKSVLGSTALSAMFYMASPAMGQSPTCGCEQSAPTCGVEFAGPSCGCESPVMSMGKTMPNKPVWYRPRSLSFAEKFLKHLDKVGDQIEWEAACGTSCQSCTCAAQTAAKLYGPTCGCENAPGIPLASLPSCECGPSVPMGLPNSWSRAGQGRAQNQPFANNARAGQGRASDSVGNTPMFPGRSKDVQALGKISDNGSSISKIEKPIAAPALAAPALERTQPPLSNRITPPTQSPTNSNSSSADLATPGEISSPRTLPQSETSTKTDWLPALQPVPTEPRNSLPPEPSPMFPPSLPQSQDEIPDVLIDPFKDDVSWKSNRNRLNGVRLTSGELTNPLRPIAATNEAQPKLLPTPYDDVAVIQTELPPVVVKPKVINRYRSNNAELIPTVNRVAVPKKKD